MDTSTTKFDAESDAESDTDQQSNLFGITDLLTAERENNTKLDDFLQDKRQKLSKIYNHIKKISEDETYLGKLDIVQQDLICHLTEFNSICNQLDDEYERNKFDRGASSRFDDISTFVCAIEIYHYFLIQVSKIELENKTDGSSDTLLLKPYNELTLKFTTSENYLISVCRFCTTLNHYCLTLALTKNKIAYQRIHIIYKFLTVILDNLMNIKIARNCGLRRAYDAVKWQKRDVQKICYDLMLIEEDCEVGAAPVSQE